VCNDLDAREHLDAADQLVAGAGQVGRVATGRLFDHLECPGAEHFERDIDIVACERGGEHQDRRGAVGHNMLGGCQPIHHRHAHIHGNDIGAQLLH